MSDPKVGDRFRELIEQLGDEFGRPSRGWKTRVAQKLGIDPTYITKVTTGGRQVGLAAAERAAQHLGISMDFFVGSREGATHYTRFLLDPTSFSQQKRREDVESWRLSRRFDDDMASIMLAAPQTQVAFFERLASAHRSRFSHRVLERLEAALLDLEKVKAAQPPDDEKLLEARKAVLGQGMRLCEALKQEQLLLLRELKEEGKLANQPEQD